MNVLHICANPRPIEESVTKQLAARFFSRLVEKNPEVTVNNVDLYQEPPPFLNLAAYRYFWERSQKPGHEMNREEDRATTYARAQGEMLRQADVLVLTMPFWCGGIPSIMKAWLDQVMQPTIMYSLDVDGIKPLHQLRRVVVLVSSNDVYKEGDPRDGLSSTLQNNFTNIGVTELSFAWADGQDQAIYPDWEERKQNAFEMAEDLADEVSEQP
jgi:FMN-dependent NADH-azoreductase